MKDYYDEYNSLYKALLELTEKIETEANKNPEEGERKLLEQGKMIAYSHVYFELTDVLKGTKDKERERNEKAMLLLPVILACVIGGVLGSLFIYPFLKAFLDQL